MRRIHRAALIALVIAAGPALAGCSDFDLDKLDVLGLNQKKKLPGERRPVFPEGVPGVTQGVPPEYLKGHEQAQTGAAVPIEPLKPTEAAGEGENEKKTAAAEPAAKPKPKAKRVAKRPPRIKIAPKEEPASAEPAAAPQAPVNAQPASAASPGWPPPAQSAPAPWPQAPPTGTFSKQ